MQIFILAIKLFPLPAEMTEFYPKGYWRNYQSFNHL